MKTLVAAKHELGPFENGVGGCHARCGNGGKCPGHETAEWLNKLGEDDDVFIKGNPKVPGAVTVTCGQVRSNWLAGEQHLVAVNPSLASLTGERQRLRRELARLNREIKRLTDSKKTFEGKEVHDHV